MPDGDRGALSAAVAVSFAVYVHVPAAAAAAAAAAWLESLLVVGIDLVIRIYIKAKL